MINITSQLHENDQTLGAMQDFLIRYIWVNHDLISLRVAIDKGLITLTQFKAKLSDLFDGHLTPNIINPIDLRQVLVEIESNLPRGFALPFSIKTHLFRYYQYLECHIQRVGGEFTIVMGVPLTDESSRFHLVQVQTFDIPFCNTSVVATYDLGSTYVAISPDFSQIMLNHV